MLDWISWSDFRRIYEALHGRYVNSVDRGTIVVLHRAFPNGAAWLNADVKAKSVYQRGRKKSEANYIIAWAWTRQICAGSGAEIESRRAQMLEYFHNNGRYLIHIVKWAQYFGLIDEHELDAIHYFYHSPVAQAVARIIAMVAFVAMKPFRELTEEDFRRGSQVGAKKSFYSKTIADIRFYLGYSSAPGKFWRPTKWDGLANDPYFGRISEEYHAHLVRAQAHPDHRTTASLVLRKLFSYLQERGQTSCAEVSYENFLEITEALKQTETGTGTYRTLIKRVRILRDFFLWGHGSEFFPRELDFPQQEWLRILRTAQEEADHADSLAFSSHEVAEQLVAAIVSDTPTSDIDVVCRCFWLIAASSPPRFSFILNLEAGEALKPLPNQPQAYGLYSADADKAGNRYGQFPILDQLGIDAVEELEARVRQLQLKPIKNRRKGRIYVHLFGLPNPPWHVTPFWIVKNGGTCPQITDLKCPPFTTPCVR
jgi:hypothetical protein